MAKAPVSKLIPVLVAEFWVVGLEHHQGLRRWNDLEPATPILLEPEPENTYDPHAVRVMLDGDQIGYVEKKLAKRLQPILLQGVTYKAKITVRDADAPKYEQILAAFYLMSVKV